MLPCIPLAIPSLPSDREELPPDSWLIKAPPGQRGASAAARQLLRQATPPAGTWAKIKNGISSSGKTMPDVVVVFVWRHRHVGKGGKVTQHRSAHGHQHLTH